MYGRMIGAVMGALLPVVTAAQSSWLDDPGIQNRLSAGEVVVRVALEGNEVRGRIKAAIRINAQPEAIWNVMTDCERAPEFIPGLKRCRRIQVAPNGTWELIEREIKYSWLMPTVHDVLRADYQRPRRIDFVRVSGDLKDEEGTWLLEDAPDASATIVEYELYVDPGFWIPRFLVQRSLATNLPAAMKALRTRVEAVEAALR
jgi:ribosome-associated toxin RatA of RatAB toxin-antitoxin module